MEKGNILEIKNLQVTFYTEDGIVRALQGVSYEVPDNETLGVVGESGCGKSVTALTVMRLLPKPQARVEGGEIWFKDKETGQEINILEQSEEHMRHIRGNKISMIFQEPMTALNPVYTVGDQIMEAIMVHNPDISKKEARERAIEMLKVVGIPAPEKRVDDYPHQMSGGMRQRVMIAMALSTNQISFKDCISSCFCCYHSFIFIHIVGIKIYRFNLTFSVKFIGSVRQFRIGLPAINIQSASGYKVSQSVYSEVSGSCEFECVTASAFYNKESVSFNCKVGRIIGSLNTSASHECVNGLQLPDPIPPAWD